jgi:pullulanase/glycogen debranching enzyme
MWLATDGNEMQTRDWHAGGQHAFACLLSAPARPAGGSAQLAILFNPEPQATDFGLPAGRWQLAIDSSADLPPGAEFPGPAQLRVPGRALLVLRRLD